MPSFSKCILICRRVYSLSLINSIEIDRNLQDGSIEVDGGVEVSKRSPGKLRQLNTDTGLYVGEWLCIYIYLYIFRIKSIVWQHTWQPLLGGVCQHLIF